MCRERSAGRLRPSCGSGPRPAPGQGDSPRLRPPGPPTRRAPAPRITRRCRCASDRPRPRAWRAPPGSPRRGAPAGQRALRSCSSAASASAAMSSPPIFPVSSGPEPVRGTPAPRASWVRHGGAAGPALSMHRHGQAELRVCTRALWLCGALGEGLVGLPGHCLIPASLPIL